MKNHILLFPPTLSFFFWHSLRPVFLKQRKKKWVDNNSPCVITHHTRLLFFQDKNLKRLFHSSLTNLPNKYFKAFQLISLANSEFWAYFYQYFLLWWQSELVFSPSFPWLPMLPPLGRLNAADCANSSPSALVISHGIYPLTFSFYIPLRGRSFIFAKHWSCFLGRSKKYIWVFYGKIFLMFSLTEWPMTEFCPVFLTPEFRLSIQTFETLSFNSKAEAVISTSLFSKYCDNIISQE